MVSMHCTGTSLHSDTVLVANGGSTGTVMMVNAGSATL